MKGLLTENLKLSGKKILLRLDLNVPLKDKSITETNRIEKVIPTINFLLKKKSKIIILSHIGRPKGKVNPNLTLEPVSKKLSEILGTEVMLIKDEINEKLTYKIDSIKNTSVIMLENIRFNKGEEANEQIFAKKLSKLGEIYVNDAFSCSHRSHASIEAITKYIPSYFGIQIIEEVNALKKITSEIKKPVSCILGGSKISTKINIISNLIKKFDNIIIVGGMANTILKEKGLNIGKSINEDGCKKIVNEIFKNVNKYNCKIICPLDVIVSKNIDSSGKNKLISEIENDDIILDIGKNTISKIESIISNSNTILWNGPAGYFENPLFENGTKQIAKIISTKTKQDNIFSVVGGGDTVAAINKFNLFDSFTFVSTAGGAFLEFLEGKNLPGINAISSK
tara:strand:- start:3868 stop:5055 length:1188 start_codon:yes stop_codon:yes gene_type:complete